MELQQQETPPSFESSRVQSFIDYHADRFETYCDAYGFPYFMLQDIHKGFRQDLTGFLQTIPSIPSSNISWKSVNIDERVLNNVESINRSGMYGHLSNIIKQSIAMTRFIEDFDDIFDSAFDTSNPAQAIIRLKLAQSILRSSLTRHFDQNKSLIHPLELYDPREKFIAKIGLSQFIDQPAIKSILNLGKIAINNQKDSYVSFTQSHENAFLSFSHNEQVTDLISLRSSMTVYRDQNFSFSVNELYKTQSSPLLSIELQDGLYKYNPNIPIHIPKLPIPVKGSDGQIELEYHECEVAYIHVEAQPSLYQDLTGVTFGLYDQNHRVVTHECSVQSNLRGYSQITLKQIEHARKYVDYPEEIIARYILSAH